MLCWSASDKSRAAFCISRPIRTDVQDVKLWHMQAEVAQLREQCHRNTDANARCEVLRVQVNDLSDLLAASRQSRDEREELQAQASMLFCLHGSSGGGLLHSTPL